MSYAAGAAALSPVGGTALDPAVRSTLEGAFGADLSDVRVKIGDAAVLQAGARAIARGDTIHFAPGEYAPASTTGLELIGHETMHLQQQRDGRASGPGDQLLVDAALEAEADRAGAAVAKGEKVDSPSAGAGGSAGLACQPMMGMEIEMKVFIDQGGRAIPEKTKFGTYGSLKLDVDESNIGDAECPATDTQWSLWNGGESKYQYYDEVASTWSDDEAMGATHARYASIIEVVTEPYAIETDAGRKGFADAITEAAELAGKLDTAKGTRQQASDIAGLTAEQPYYSVGHDSAAQTVSGSIQTTIGLDLSQLASFIETTILPAPTQGMDPDDPSTWGAVDGSVMAKERENDMAPFKMKHHSDTIGMARPGPGEDYTPGHFQVDSQQDEGDRVKSELPASVANARATIDAVLAEVYPDVTDKDTKDAWKEELLSMEGLLVLMAQYLRMGRHFLIWDRDPETGDILTDTGGANKLRKRLDKNCVALMSRTDLSDVFKDLVRDSERPFVDFRGMLGKFETHLLAKTGRTGDKALLNFDNENLAPGVAPGMDWDPGCSGFIQNVFTQGKDGVTRNFGALEATGGVMGPEAISQDGSREGTIFEMRNMVPRLAGLHLENRFQPRDWLKLAQYLGRVTEVLNTRDQTVRTAVPTRGRGGLSSTYRNFGK